jgi:hypothetical protein
VLLIDEQHDVRVHETREAGLLDFEAVGARRQRREGVVTLAAASGRARLVRARVDQPHSRVGDDGPGRVCDRAQHGAAVSLRGGARRGGEGDAQ